MARYRPRYLKKRHPRLARRKALDRFLKKSLRWFPVWASPLLALAAAVSLLAGDIVVMAGAVTCFFCAVVSSVLLVQAERLAASDKIKRLEGSRKEQRDAA